MKCEEELTYKDVFENLKNIVKEKQTNNMVIWVIRHELQFAYQAGYLYELSRVDKEYLPKLNQLIDSDNLPLFYTSLKALTNDTTSENTTH